MALFNDCVLASSKLRWWQKQRTSHIMTVTVAALQLAYLLQNVLESQSSAFMVRVECRAEKNPGCAFTWAELCSAAVLPHLHPGWAHQAKPLCTHTAQQVCPAAPARWEPGASAACRDLPLAWTRTHLITASFNYCASLPKGFQPSLLLKSHSCKFLASLSHMVAAAGASLHPPRPLEDK